MVWIDSSTHSTPGLRSAEKRSRDNGKLRNIMGEPPIARIGTRLPFSRRRILHETLTVIRNLPTTAKLLRAFETVLRSTPSF
jgi:hypothetical protein